MRLRKWTAALSLVALCSAGGAAGLELELLGEVRIPTGVEVDGVEVGGLSGIAWDPVRDLYLAVSDHRGVDDPYRLIELRLDLDDGTLEPADLELVGAVVLRDPDGNLLEPWSADLEGIARAADGGLYLSSEGDAPRGAKPFLARFDRDGREAGRIPLPRAYRPGEGSGVRTNLAFESLTLAAGGRRLVTATENALEQDGPPAGIGNHSPSRILVLDLPSGRVAAEYLYPVDPLPTPPNPPDAFATNGLADLLALDDGRLLALERWFAVGAGHGARLFLVELAGATDLSGVEAVAELDDVRPVAKRLVLDLAELGIGLDNLEGMTWGPRLVDGRRTLVLISDNNFKPIVQFTQVLAFAVGPPPHGERGVTVSRLQGGGHHSPLVGRWASGVEGVVVGLRPASRGGGFWLQSASGDDDPATSEGIWVRPQPELELAPGDRVEVAGLVVEAGPPDELTVTCLEQARVSRRGPGQLPAPVVIGAAGRVPPASTVDDDGMAVFEPDADAIDFFESLEGMRVRLERPRVVGPTSRYGEIWVVADGGEGAGPITARGGLLRTPTGVHPEVLPVEAPGRPAAQVGDLLGGPVEGVLDFAFGRYRVVAEQLPALGPGGLRAETTRLLREPGRLTVATFNVENLAAGSGRMAAVAEVVADRLGGPELVALQEIQDDSGSRDDGTVSAAGTLDELVTAVAQAGGPRYRWLQLDPRDGAEGGQPGGNIRVALLVDPERVRVVERSEVATDVVAIGPGPRLLASPARLEHPAFEGDPEGEASGARRPLLAELEVEGRTVFVAVVHLTSKGGDDRPFGPHQPPCPRSQAQRTRQTAAIASVVERLLAEDPEARVIVLGDFNEFEERPPMRGLERAGLVNLTWVLPRAERFTYVFQGVSQALDHVLVSRSLAEGAEVDVVHVNSEFPARERTSDHDPVLARVVLAGSGR